MKKILLTLAIFTWFQTAFGQNIIQFKISKPYGIFNFLETATHQQGTSSTLGDFISSNQLNDADFQQLCQDFLSVKTDYSYRREEFPESRRQHRSTKDLIYIALVNSHTINEFQHKITGILPNSEQQKLVQVLQKAEKVYDKMLWKDSQTKLFHQQKELEKYAAKSQDIFSFFQHFYQSSWSVETPFVVALYPIPGSKGNSTATPHANSLCVGVMVDETQHFERFGVVLHEMCHVLYDEQPNEFQHDIEKWFNENTSPYKSLAYNFFDEGLATALGNGWAVKNISGKVDSTEWYDNEYINGFAKVLFPEVEEYLATHKTIDQAFVDKAVDLFASKFPEAITSYGILLNRVSIYTDAENETERRNLMKNFWANFQLTSTNLSTPILDKTSLDMLKNGSNTQLVVINRNHKSNFKVLKKMFPELSKMNPKSSTIFSFIDATQRPIIVLYALEEKDLAGQISKMRSMKFFDINRVIQE